MKLGFVSAILPDLPMEEVVTLAAEIGYQCVEMMAWPPGKADRRYAGVTHINVDELDDAGVRRIHDCFSQAGITLGAIGYYPNPLAADGEQARVAITHLETLIDAAARLEVPVVNTFLGRDPRRSVDDNWPRFLEVWKPLVKRAGERGVRIAIENCPMLFTGDEWPGGNNLAQSPAIWRRMFESIPDQNFGLNYDPSHLVWQQMDYLAPLRDFRERIFHVHLKDVRVDRDRLNQVGILATPLEYHAPTLPGLGDIDWGKFLSVLGDTGYQGPICVEVEDRAFESDLTGRKAALAQAHRFLRPLVS